ncbi:MAG: hypothetical protein HC902_08600 [Calothrix sp. SM1_5_4]|nr:hypothetical protein [Calothrix sp. SM1_5_4]
MSIESGYELIRLETHNWGNFHNLHKIDITKVDPHTGPLEFYMSKRATVVAGINGAGKTTLIDPIFCVLMPFQNRISLGVIADAEKTGRKSGGRSIADYVLGKHSARDEEKASDPSLYYSRQNLGFLRSSLFSVIAKQVR